MALIDARTSRVLFTTVLFAMGLGFLYVARRTLVAFLFAIFFAYLMEPAVSRLEKLLRGRGRAIAAIYFLLLIGVALFFFFVGPRIGREAARLGQALPSLLNRLSTGSIVHEIGQEHGWSLNTQDRFREFLIAHSDDIKRYAEEFGLRAAGVAKEAWLIILVPLLAIFFLKDGRSFSDVALSLVQSRPQREFLQAVVADMNQMLAQFIRSQLTLAALSLVVYIAFLGAVGAPYALVLGTAGGVMEFIPVVGPLVAALIMLSVAVLMSFPHWGMLLVFLVVWRLVQDYVVSPRVMGKSMELHPLAAIFGVMAGGEIAGVLGVYLSIPVMASLRIVWRRGRIYVEKKRFGPLNEYVYGSEGKSSGSRA
jgi:predicted PurR-regulated permease PerM